MKKFLSILLTMTLLLTCIPLGALPAFAEEEPETPVVTPEENPVYYTDLFYAYPYYLADDAYLALYAATLESVYNRVHDSYTNSPMVLGTGMEKALDVITSPTDIAKLMTDILGLTDFSYAEALGAANEAFLKNLLPDSTLFAGDEIIAAHKQYADTLNTAISLFNDAEFKDEAGATQTVEGYVNLAFSYLLKSGKIRWVSDGMVSKLWNELNDSEFALKDCFKLAKTELEMAQAIIYCVVLEDIRIGLVDDILATQKSNTVLKQGMNLLKIEMTGNFAVRFCKQFMNTTVADQIWDAIDKLTEEAIENALKEVISVSKLKAILKMVHIAYNALLDVPKFADVLKWQVLMCYSRDLAAGISTRALAYAQGPFISDEIGDYEALFMAYKAINSAMLDVADAILDMQDPFGEAYMVLVEARDRGETAVLLKTGLDSIYIPSDMSSEEFYDLMRLGLWEALTESNGVVTYLLNSSISVQNTTTTVKLSRKLNTMASIFRTAISDNFLYVKEFKEVDPYTGHIASVKNTIQNIPIAERIAISKDVYSQWVYSFTPENNLRLRHGSDIVESNCIYAVNGVLLGNVKLYNSINAPETALFIDGYIRVGSAGVTITGNLDATGNLSILDDCSLAIYGKMSVNDVAGGWRTLLQVYGELVCNNLDGLANTEVFGSVYTMENFAIPYWAKATLFGTITANNVSYGYDAVVNMYGTIVCNNFTAGGIGTIYGDVTVTQNLGIDHLLTIAKTGSLVAGGNSSIALFGDWINYGYVRIGGDFTLGYGTLTENYGELVVDGTTSLGTLSALNNWGIVRTHDITVSSNNNGNYNAQTDKVILYVSGDIDKPYGNFGGVVVFDGTEKQTSNLRTYSTVIIENSSEEGVLLNPRVNNAYNSITVNTLFNHKNNTFEIDASSLHFPDYDGDGMKDNIDPEPTVGNPCALYFYSDDIGKGIVSVESVSTIGGTEVTVEATPTAKYEFLRWEDASGKIVSASSKLELVAKGDATYVAVFQKRSQPIMVEVDGGTITAPEKAEIESTVTVTVVENAGFVYEEGSLSCNGVPVINNSFIMPDEPVKLMANFVRNEAYFALVDTLTDAKTHVATLYTAESFARLTSAISVAENILYNHITVEESNAQSALLQQAIAELEKCLVVGGQTSVSEDVNGLAFKFDVAANNGRVHNGTRYVDSSAEVVPYLGSESYKLVRMGAVVSNQSDAVLDLENVNGGTIINIPAVYLCEMDETSLSFAVRIINIPEQGMDTAIFACPYYVYEKDGEEVIVYGNIVSKSYNAALNE